MSEQTWKTDVELGKERAEEAERQRQAATPAPASTKKGGA